MKVTRHRPLSLTGVTEVDPLPPEALDSPVDDLLQPRAPASGGVAASEPEPAPLTDADETAVRSPTLHPAESPAEAASEVRTPPPILPRGERPGDAARISSRPAAPPPSDSRPPPRPITAPVPRKEGRGLYVAAVVAALAWAGGIVAFVAGFQTLPGVGTFTTPQWALLGLLAALPATFILLAAFALRQGARMAADARAARALADDLAVPAALAVDQAGGVVQAMRREIERAGEAALAASQPIAALRESLSAESRRLSEAAAEAQETSRLLGEALGRERSALGEMAGTLQLQAAEAAEALARQAKVVAEASDLAQAQLDQAQAALAARAADLVLAAGDARHATETADQQLTGQIERLEGAGAVLGQRLQGLSADVGREGAQLASLAETLRTDQEDLAARLESRRVQLTDAVAESREGAAALVEASATGAEALRSMIAVAAEEVRRLAQSAQREQGELEARARAAVGLFSGVVAEEREAIEAQTRDAIGQLANAAEEARIAAAGHADSAAQAALSHTAAAREGLGKLADDVAARIDSLGEAAFVAGQKADQAFEGRIAAARMMIDESAALADATGERSAQRIEQSLATARTALTEMEGFIREIDAQMTRLPQEARVQAEAVRAAVATGVNELTAAARRAAEETQAIDAAFQDRVRKNYDMLSDAMRLMGAVASATEQAKTLPIKPAAPVIRPTGEPAPAPTPEPRLEPRSERLEPRAADAVALPELQRVAGGDRNVRPIAAPDAAAARLGADQGAALRPAALSDGFVADSGQRRTDGVSAAAAGLRPRLRLTPATPDDTASRLPRPAPKAAEGDEWTWKDLLSSMDEPGAPEEDASAATLVGEIQMLGIDAGLLLPRPRIDEIAAVLQTGDASGAREVVRRLAPAAVRRLSRRVLTDKALRVEADRYVRRYEGLLKESAGRDRAGFMLANLLGTEPGRAFLLLDAAVGDLH